MNKIIVENDTMRFYSTPVPIPVGGSQWSKIFFMFSDEWEDLRKIAQFRQGELKINVDIDSNNFCYVPNEMLTDMCGELSIVGYPQDTASTTIATANSLMLNFVQGFESGGEPAIPPTPDLYQKLMKEFAESGGGNPDAVLYTEQALTYEQQEQARTNIGAGQPVFAVNVTLGVGEDGRDNYTADKTAAEIEVAYQAGRTIVCKTQAKFLIGYIPVELPLMSRTQERVFSFAGDQLVGSGIFTITVNISDSGVEVSTDMVEIYEQPVGGIPKSDLAQSVQTSLAKADTAISLGLTSATPGQIIKVKTVQDGKPTEWEAVDMPSQPDWNQNDSTQPDYVKNRPFYTGNPVETVLVEESTVQFTDIGGVCAGAIESTFSPTVGNAYKVYWDGTDYESACVEVGQDKCIGNLSIDGSGPDTGEPFLMYVTNQGIDVATLNSASYHTISISRFVPGVVKIDEKYLPDTIATKQYVDTAKTEAQQLGLTSATPGQIIKVKTVQDGKPTEWEAVDMPSGGGDEWELIAHINVADDVEKDVTVWEYNNLPRYKCIAYKKVNLVGSSEQTPSGCSIKINGENTQPSGMGYGKSNSPQSCIGMIYVMPFGWTHWKTTDANSPDNIAFGDVNAMHNALPLSDNAITSIMLSANPLYKIASGEIWLYGKKE